MHMDDDRQEIFKPSIWRLSCGKALTAVRKTDFEIFTWYKSGAKLRNIREIVLVAGGDMRKLLEYDTQK